jgi:hypothetical protein
MATSSVRPVDGRVMSQKVLVLSFDAHSDVTVVVIPGVETGQGVSLQNVICCAIGDRGKGTFGLDGSDQSPRTRPDRWTYLKRRLRQVPLHAVNCL